MILAHNDIAGIVGEEQEWYQLQRLNVVPCHLFEIQTTPPHGHSALVAAHELIMVVSIPRVTETLNKVINEMIQVTDFKLINLIPTKNVNCTHEYLNTSIDKPKNRWNIHPVSYDTSISRAKPPSIHRLSHCSWSFGIFNKSHPYKMKNRVGWSIAMNVRIGFKLPVTPTQRFHSLYKWCYQTKWLFQGAPADPENETVMEKDGADTLYSIVTSLMHAIRTDYEDPLEDVACQMIHIAKPLSTRRWSVLKIVNGTTLDPIPT